MKKAVAVRMPGWPEAELTTSKQIELYVLFWEHQRKPLAPDPGAGFLQKSFWLDPRSLEINARLAECFRAGRPDRALYVRRLIATYHERTSKPIPTARPPLAQAEPQTGSSGLGATMRQVLQRLSAPTAIPQAELSPAEVNEISRVQGLGIGWQPGGNVYRLGRTASAKYCLVLIDAQGRELARYGSW
jgi:hypothetical protein